MDFFDLLSFDITEMTGLCSGVHGFAESQMNLSVTEIGGVYTLETSFFGTQTEISNIKSIASNGTFESDLQTAMASSTGFTSGTVSVSNIFEINS